MEIHLASMENITCWAFRKLCRGASDSYTGMLSLTNLIKRNNTWEEIDTFPIEGQRQWIQITTSKEAECAAFFKRLEEEIKKHPEKDNVYGIQLNASCPSLDLIRLGQGPALIKRPTKISNLIKELLKQTKYKVGIKLRLGLNELEVEERRIFTLFRELEKIAKDNPNFTNVTIHLKHAQANSSDKYDYSFLKELATYNLPLVLNGGIKTSEDIKKLLALVAPENKKNIKGVMLARVVLKNPNCFLEIGKDINGLPLISRNFKELAVEFNELCKQHRPHEIYLKTIEENLKFNLER